MEAHRTASREEWLAARKALLAREKEHTRARDALNDARLALPWVKLEKRYEFETEEGPRSLADLFAGRRQLLVYHFMFAPGWNEGCKGCSFVADHLDGPLLHLPHHDVSVVMVARAKLAELLAYKRRMGWKMPWVSSYESDFNRDFGVSSEADGTWESYNYAPAREGMPSELPGLSAFFRDETGQIFHTYSTFERGLEEFLSTYALLDRAPLGRNETGTMSWVRHHDTYSG